jgi:ribA/ribD-fused uncharacterized protein
MNTMIKEFQGEYRFLSNFYPAKVVFEGELYPAVEHAYVAAKTLDKEMRRQIAAIVKASDVKRFGRKIELRPDWDDVKLSIMEELVRQKFTNNPELKQKLLATDDWTIEEGNYWNDTFWGVCRGRGQNHLGKIITKVRNELRQPALF